MHEGYELFEEVPEPAVFCQLRLDAGMSHRSVASAIKGLPQTLFGVTVRYDDVIVGMGRIVGDGGLCFQIADVAVHPDHQFKGLGKAIMGRLGPWLHANVPAGSFVGLMADGEAHTLYAQFGFVPTAPKSIGMWLRIP